PAEGVRGQTRTFILSANDPSMADQAAGFTYTINWGDGSATQTIGATAGNGAGTLANHVFTATGTYSVQVTAADKDGGVSSMGSHSVAIGLVGMQVDPVDAT